MADPDLTPAKTFPTKTVVPGSWFTDLQEDIRTAAAHFDGSTPPTAAQIDAGRIYSQALEANGGLYHALKEATGASSGETDWKKLAARVAHIHVVTSITGLQATISGEAADAEGRKLYRPGQLVVALSDGSFQYIYTDGHLLPFSAGYLVDEELSASRFIPTGSAALEEHGGTNGAWPRLVLPDAVTSQAFAMITLPNSTQNARLRFRLYGSSPGTTGQVAKLSVGFRDIRPGDTVDSADDDSTAVDWTNPGAGVLGDVLTDLEAPFRVDSGRRMLRVTVTRTGGDGGDTLAADFHLYGLRVEQLNLAQQYTTP